MPEKILDDLEKIKNKKVVEISLEKFEKMVVKIKEYKKANAYLNSIIQEYNTKFGSLDQE